MDSSSDFLQFLKFGVLLSESKRFDAIPRTQGRFEVLSQNAALIRYVSINLYSNSTCIYPTVFRHIRVENV